MNEITTLPDGSAFFTATVMSEEEAMALPLKERPLCYRISGEVYHAVFEAIGTASMCWNPPPSFEVFDTSQAEKVAVDLCFKIAEDLEERNKLSVELPIAPGFYWLKTPNEKPVVAWVYPTNSNPNSGLCYVDHFREGREINAETCAGYLWAPIKEPNLL